MLRYHTIFKFWNFSLTIFVMFIMAGASELRAETQKIGSWTRMIKAENLSGYNSDIRCGKMDVEFFNTDKLITTCDGSINSSIYTKIKIDEAGYYTIRVNYGNMMHSSSNPYDKPFVKFYIDGKNPIARCSDGKVKNTRFGVWCGNLWFPARGDLVQLHIAELGIFYLSAGEHEIRLVSDKEILPRVRMLGYAPVEEFYNPTGNMDKPIMPRSIDSPRATSPAPTQYEPSVRVRYEDPGSVIILYFTNRTGRDQRCSGSYDYSYRIAGEIKYGTNNFSVPIANNGENFHRMQGSYVNLKVTSQIRMQCS